MTALGDFLGGLPPEPDHRPFPRVAMSGETWRLASEALAEGALSLAGLWGDTAMVHMAVADPGCAEYAVLSLPCVGGTFPSVARLHPPALRLERTIADLFGHAAEGATDGRPWLDHGRWPARPPLAVRLRTAPVEPYAFLPAEGEILAVFPGSRRAELARHLRPFVETAQELQRRRPGLTVIVSVAPTVRIDPSECPFPLVHGQSFTVLRAATAGLLKSGTTTLEAAVAGLPHVIGYRTSAITYGIARRVVKIPHIGLVNVVAGREVSREFVQDAFVPTVVATALEPLLDVDDPVRVAACDGLAAVRGSLGTPGAASRVAAMAVDLVR